MIAKCISFSINSHLFLSISTFIFSIGLLNRNEQSIYLSVALSLAVFGVYNLNRLSKLKKNQLSVEMQFWYNKYSEILHVSSSICLLISVLLYSFLLMNKPLTILLLGITALITTFYIFTIKRFNLRKIPGTKSIWVSVAWTCIVVIVPKIISDSFNWSNLHNFILFFALTIPGDIRDSKIDEPEMNSIPQLIGNQLATWLFYLLIGLFSMFSCQLENRDLFMFIPVFLFCLFFIQKRLTFRYELMDGLLLVLGICYITS